MRRTLLPGCPALDHSPWQSPKYSTTHNYFPGWLVVPPSKPPLETPSLRQFSPITSMGTGQGIPSSHPRLSATHSLGLPSPLREQFLPALPGTKPKGLKRLKAAEMQAPPWPQVRSLYPKHSARGWKMNYDRYALLLFLKIFIY